MDVVCSDSVCKYNGCQGYYGVCNNLCNQNLHYGGITRMLMESCSKADYEREELCNDKIREDRSVGI